MAGNRVPKVAEYNTIGLIGWGPKRPKTNILYAIFYSRNFFGNLEGVFSENDFNMEKVPRDVSEKSTIKVSINFSDIGTLPVKLERVQGWKKRLEFCNDPDETSRTTIQGWLAIIECANPKIDDLIFPLAEYLGFTSNQITGIDSNFNNVKFKSLYKVDISDNFDQYSPTCESMEKTREMTIQEFLENNKKYKKNTLEYLKEYISCLNSINSGYKRILQGNKPPQGYTWMTDEDIQFKFLGLRSIYETSIGSTT